ncbi:TadE/TadG family type IV pilus assembly protein [Aureliella helgolandensis]|nr:TadE family protein [Aureliella helgolandensis]
MRRGVGSSTASNPSRRGVAVVETALMLPVIVLLVFTSLEIADGIFLKQAVTIAAYEGARAATRPGGTNATASARIAEVLAAREVADYTVVYTPEITPTTPRGTEVTVTVRAPSAAYSMNPMRLLENRVLEKQVTMVRM